MRRLAPIGLAALLLLAAGATGMWQQYRRFLHTPLQIGPAGLVLEVAPGSSVRSVLGELEQRGATQLGWRWRLLGRLRPVTIQAGEYQLPAGLRPHELLSLLASGKVVSYRFTIVEGWTVRQLLEALAKDPVLRQTLSATADLGSLPGLPGANPEGWFLPETYVYVRGDPDVQILQRAYAAMRQKLSQAWEGRDEGLPYETPYELLTLASIIEKETSLEAERRAIAGVFVRRLLKRWRLETDPSVIYGMGQAYQGDIRRRDLRKDTLYNTYTRHGLPPTPIALPGQASLLAAAHPQAGEAMFFVANGRGGHTFSSTLEEHNRAVAEMLKAAGGGRDRQGERK